MAAVDQYLQQANANRAQYQQQGTNIDNQLQNKLGYYNGNEANYQNQADTAYADLAQTPGYTGGESSAITGNPNAAFNYYDPNGLKNLTSQGNANFAGSTADYRGDLTNSAAAADSGVGLAADRLQGQDVQAAGQWGTGVTNAAQAAQTNLNAPANAEEGNLGGVYGYLKGANDQSVGGYGSALNGAVDPSKLGLSSSFANNYAMSPEEIQNVKNVAAQTTAGQYSKMSDQAKMQAAAQGNTSPAALAAIEQNLGRQGAIDAGNAASTAELSANAQAAQRAQNLEQMRLGTAQDISSRQTANAGNLYNAQAGAAQNLAGLESQGIQGVAGTRQAGAAQGANLGYTAANTGGQAMYDAANSGGQANLTAAQYQGNMGYNAANTGGQAALTSGQYSANRDLATAQGNQSTGQTLAANADNTASARATGIANQRITGQNNYRGYLTGQQGTAQQGSETASGQQIQNFGTTAGAQNQATSTAVQGQLGQDQIDKQPGEGERIGMGLTKTFFAEGGVATKPTLAVIGERRPEMVVPLGKPRFGRYGMPRAA